MLYFRKMFVASEGHQFLLYDYSLIEIVLLAVLANEVTMLENILSGRDFHIFLASKILKQTSDELMDLQETNPKEFKRILNGFVL